jgi:hypothetical protein
VEVSESIFGLCMMIIGILVLGVAILHQNQLRFLDLGHVGGRKLKLTPLVPEAEDNTTAAAAILSGDSGSMGGASTQGNGAGGKEGAMDSAGYNMVTQTETAE